MSPYLYIAFGILIGIVISLFIKRNRIRRDRTPVIRIDYDPSYLDNSRKEAFKELNLWALTAQEGDIWKSKVLGTYVYLNGNSVLFGYPYSLISLMSEKELNKEIKEYKERLEHSS